MRRHSFLYHVCYTGSVHPIYTFYHFTLAPSVHADSFDFYVQVILKKMQPQHLCPETSVTLKFSFELLSTIKIALTVCSHSMGFRGTGPCFWTDVAVEFLRCIKNKMFHLHCVDVEAEISKPDKSNHLSAWLDSKMGVSENICLRSSIAWIC